MERIFTGSEGIEVRIYGKNEALAAITPPPPVTPTPPNVSLLTLLSGTPVSILQAPNDQTFIGTMVDDPIINAYTVVGAPVGSRFRLLLDNRNGFSTALEIRIKSDKSEFFPVAATASFIHVELMVVETGFVYVTSVKYPNPLND